MSSNKQEQPYRSREDLATDPTLKPGVRRYYQEQIDGHKEMLRRRAPRIDAANVTNVDFSNVRRALRADRRTRFLRIIYALPALAGLVLFALIVASFTGGIGAAVAYYVLPPIGTALCAGFGGGCGFWYIMTDHWDDFWRFRPYPKGYIKGTAVSKQDS